MKCKERLLEYLTRNGVQAKTMSHSTAYTSQEVAAAQHVSGKRMAKVVIVRAGERNVMAVLPANEHIDFRKLESALGPGPARLAGEDEFGDIFPDCDLGAMPPFGNLYDLPVYVDTSLASVPEIVFQVGTHRDTFAVPFADFARLAQPVTLDFTP